VLFHRSVDIICGLLFYPPFTTALYGGPLFGQPLRNDIGGVLFGCILRAAIYGGARCLLTVFPTTLFFADTVMRHEPHVCRYAAQAAARLRTSKLGQP